MFVDAVFEPVWIWIFFFKQKTADEMRISDWSSDVCSSDLGAVARRGKGLEAAPAHDCSAAKPCNLAQRRPCGKWGENGSVSPLKRQAFFQQIGRAACRERVCQYV